MTTQRRPPILFVLASLVILSLWGCQKGAFLSKPKAHILIAEMPDGKKTEHQQFLKNHMLIISVDDLSQELRIHIQDGRIVMAGHRGIPELDPEHR